MAETLIAVISTTVALGALYVSWAGHRHQVRRARETAQRERETAERERGIEAREREAAERARQAESREALVQASLIDVRLRTVPSAIHPGYVTPQLDVINRSSHPVRELAATLHEQPVPEVCGDVNAATGRTFTLPSGRSGEVSARLADVRLSFTDAAGAYWRRDGDGGLRRGTERDGVTTWGPREEPVIRAVDTPWAAQPATSAPARPAFDFPDGVSESRAGRARPVAVVALVAAVVAAVAVAVAVLR
ncbi:hypothetical protein [Streptomyces sp. Ru87]|uniref:hypothetical protein n=1 Tax=Streptomyces sp. Ru87 TaxID=2044307 RepID=UPI000BF3FFA2|nr:hypothetical protein [Streptomyces sp. Ru87]PGH46720.1 hypothetical protein CRI70_32485 [Streptomyces sp. Ru87]